ncbi:MAG: hypothetical protein Q9N34_09830 [Aquificota bacterium]|nr:hypothetical protein [Aquificota bacterium]
MFKYYLYVTDGNDETGSAGEAQTGYGVRIELAPTMMGYKGHPGAYLKETYGGKQDTLVLGISYFTQGYRGRDRCPVTGCRPSLGTELRNYSSQHIGGLCKPQELQRRG